MGAAATQAIVDVSYGPQALNLLRLSYAPDKGLHMIHVSDPDPDPVIETRGGKFCTPQGNILAGEGGESHGGSLRENAGPSL